MKKIDKSLLKKIILIIILLVVVALTCILIVLNNRNDDEDNNTENDVVPTADCSYGDINVGSWDYQKTYVIGKAYGEIRRYSMENITWLSKTTKTLDEIVDENNDYLMDFKFNTDFRWYDSKVFFDDNSYYVAYGEDGNYTFKSMYSIIGNQSSISVPTMYYMVLMDNISDCVEEHISTFFDNLTFDQNKEFYERMDEDYYSIDEEKHTISVRGWARSEKEYVDDALTIDFDNRTMTVKEYDGTTKVYK